MLSAVRCDSGSPHADCNASGWCLATAKEAQGALSRGWQKMFLPRLGSARARRRAPLHDTLREQREPFFRAAGSRHSAESVLRAVVGAGAGALTDGAECRDRGRGWNQIAFARSALTGGAGNSARVLEALSLRRMRLMFETLPVPHDGGGVIHTARAAGTADGPGVGGSGAPGRGGWSGGDTASHSAGSIAARGGVSLWRRGCCILPALCDARAGASFGGGGLLARGFRWERSGRDGLAAGWMRGRSWQEASRRSRLRRCES